MKKTQAFKIFATCAEAITKGVLIKQVSRSDKEFHFQNWFEKRLESTGILFDKSGRNSYPDFTLVEHTEGYEIKGLAWPGRESNYDCNSQVPTGWHNGRDVFYVFGRYPKPEGGSSEYPVIDLVICHGDFLNADHEYVHKNKNIKGFGSYGDIMIRDRKMYVAPTPFALADGLTGTRTFITPSTWKAPNSLKAVGELSRTEATKLVVGYEFDLKSNRINAKTIPNPSSGNEHCFTAYRIKKDSDTCVAMTQTDQNSVQSDD
ncbi:MAG: hypothetical protein JJU29_07260 [Verrucomicrobia bacterium]|nr:hypothetical protein [Verrucomicrobiota bacterium]MCH8512217.1 hypothetical protein [Kiritimatiellia bacterium]